MYKWLASIPLLAAGGAGIAKLASDSEKAETIVELKEEAKDPKQPEEAKDKGPKLSELGNSWHNRKGWESSSYEVKDTGNSRSEISTKSWDTTETSGYVKWGR